MKNKYSTTIKEDFINLRFYFSLVNRKGIGLFIMGLLYSVISGLAPSFVLKLTQNVYSIVGGIGNGEAKNYIITIIIIIIQIYLIKILLSVYAFLNRQYAVFSGEKLACIVEKQIVQQYRRIEIKHFDNPSINDILSMAASSDSVASARVLNMVLKWISCLITIISLIYIMPLEYIWLYAFSVAGAFLIYLFDKLNQKNKRKYQDETRTGYRRRNYFHGIYSSPGKAVEGKVFFGNYFKEKYINARDDIYEKEIKFNTTAHGVESFFYKIVDVVDVIAYGVCLWAVCSGKMTVDVLILVTGAVTSMSTSLYSSGLYEYADYKRFSYNIGMLRKFFELSTEKNDKSKYIHAKNVIANGECNYTFENICFKYTDRPVLKNVSFNVKSGEKIAIVGENGEGKSTLIKLIMRYYNPDSGNIYLNGVNISQIDLDEYRDMIGTMFQDYSKYSLSYKDSVSFGHDIDKDMLVELTELLNLNKVFPNGVLDIDRPMTRQFTSEGIELSEGQWQKVALLRALLSNRKILILDEPTASFDIETERRILDWIFADGKRTVFIISHQLSISTRCDKVLLLKDGEAKVFASPKELFSDKNNEYVKLFELQMQRYNNG